MEKENKPKRKLLKYILLVLLIIVVIFIVLTVRKMIIILNLQNKISMYMQSTNYHTKTSLYQGDSLTISEGYVKDDSSILYYTRLTKDDTRKMIISSGETKPNLYIESNGDKIAVLNSEALVSINIPNYTYTENFGQLLFMSIMSSIKSEKCNGKDCYYVNGVFFYNMLIPIGKYGVYIEKETGLPVRNHNGESTNSDGETIECIVDYKYEFNMVTDENLKEPDITEYKVQENI